MLFMYDFVTLSIGTDRLRPSSPERWNVRKLVKISVLLGLVKVVELFVALYITIDILKLTTHEMRTFILYILLTSGLFNIVNFRELGFFWESKTSKPLLVAIVGDIVAATTLTYRSYIVTPISLGAIAVGLIYTIAVTLVLTDLGKIAIYRPEGLNRITLV